MIIEKVESLVVVQLRVNILKPSIRVNNSFKDIIIILNSESENVTSDLQKINIYTDTE